MGVYAGLAVAIVVQTVLVYLGWRSPPSSRGGIEGVLAAFTLFAGYRLFSWCGGLVGLVATAAWAVILWRERNARRAEEELRASFADVARRASLLALRDEIQSSFSGVGGDVVRGAIPALRRVRRATAARTAALVWADDLVCSRLSPMELATYRSLLAANKPRSEIGAAIVARDPQRAVVPLRFHSQEIAVLALGARQPIERDVLEHGARSALTAGLGSVFANRALERHARLQRGLARLARTAVGSLDARQVLSGVLAVIRDELDADRCAVGMPSSEARAFVLAHEVVAPRIPPQKDTPGLTIRFTGALAEGPVVINDTFSDEPLPAHLAELRAQLAAAGVRSTAGVPLQLGGDRVGVLSVHQLTRHRRFTLDEITFLEHAAAHVTAALEACRRYDRAVEANRLKSDFIASTSHELRTPLHAILGHAELLAQAATDDRARQRILSIREAGTYLLGLVNNMIDLARIEAGRVQIVPRPVNLRDIVDAVARAGRGAVKAKPVDVRVEAPEDGLVVVTDSARLKQILMNLVGNAAKFTERGEIVLRVVARGQEVALSVSDTGPGIDPAHHDVIFEKFRQVGPGAETRGAGLGLAIARELTHLLGGTLHVDSALGRGATFTLTLPREARADALGIAS